MAAPVTPDPDLPRFRSAIERAVHTREGTGEKRALNGCTSVATATTAVHATSQNVTHIQLCIAAPAGFPLPTVVPIGGGWRAFSQNRFRVTQRHKIGLHQPGLRPTLDPTPVGLVCPEGAWGRRSRLLSRQLPSVAPAQHHAGASARYAADECDCTGSCECVYALDTRRNRYS